MMREEFVKLVKCEVTQAQYDVVEIVYAFHPSISNTKGKEQVAYLFVNFGMRVFLDMLPTAKQAQELELQIADREIHVAMLRQELQLLSHPIPDNLLLLVLTGH